MWQSVQGQPSAVSMQSVQGQARATSVQSLEGQCLAKANLRKRKMKLMKFNKICAVAPLHGHINACLWGWHLA